MAETNDGADAQGNEQEQTQPEQQTRKGRLYGRKWKITIYKPAYKTGEDGAPTDERDPEHDTEMDG